MHPGVMPVSEMDSRVGLERSGEMIAEFRESLNRWIEMVKDVKTGEELQQLYWDEVFSKVDVNEYGL